MRTFVAFILAIALPIGALAQSPSASSSKDELITIDGSKNPEQIPEWTVWGQALPGIVGGIDSAIDRGVKEDQGLPTVLFLAIPQDQHAAFIKRLRQSVADQRACNARGIAARGDLLATKDPLVWDKLTDMVIQCRRVDLKSRDDLLASLEPRGQVALKSFVEGLKSGISITMKKSELATYRIPE